MNPSENRVHALRSTREHHSSTVRFGVLAIVVLVAAIWSAELAAEPPAHAPAHGWRKKHDPEYVGYTGTRWERDYDVRSGHCNIKEIGAVLGGVAGGVIGSQVGSGDGRTVATVVGAALGALIGAKIGRNIEERDRACIGHTLEVGALGHPVSWENAATGVRYELVPGKGAKSKDGSCRAFTLVTSAGSNKERRQGKACQKQRGVWVLESL